MLLSRGSESSEEDKSARAPTRSPPTRFVVGGTRARQNAAKNPADLHAGRFARRAQARVAAESRPRRESGRGARRARPDHEVSREASPPGAAPAARNGQPPAQAAPRRVSGGAVAEAGAAIPRATRSGARVQRSGAAAPRVRGAGKGGREAAAQRGRPKGGLDWSRQRGAERVGLWGEAGAGGKLGRAEGERICLICRLWFTHHEPSGFARCVEDTAIFLSPDFPAHPPTRAGTGYARRDRFLTRASERFLRRGLRRSNPAAGSGGTGPRDRRRTKTIHFGGDFRDSGRPSVRQSRREARGSNRPPPLPNRPRLCGPPAALHFPTPRSLPENLWRAVMAVVFALGQTPRGRAYPGRSVLRVGTNPGAKRTATQGARDLLTIRCVARAGDSPAGIPRRPRALRTRQNLPASRPS
ncbi:MAG: hypothetical protein BWX54_00909 [Verrucomicrobia bacterium ADurb.Bin018]|nr:MAG: hypothetical protein BWX54_00909 [Verrucomicrobia bacterium ADurb.Bin018]